MGFIKKEENSFHDLNDRIENLHVEGLVDDREEN
jgi:hypothetical protein